MARPASSDAVTSPRRPLSAEQFRPCRQSPHGVWRLVSNAPRCLLWELTRLRTGNAATIKLVALNLSSKIPDKARRTVPLASSNMMWLDNIEAFSQEGSRKLFGDFSWINRFGSTRSRNAF